LIQVKASGAATGQETVMEEPDKLRRRARQYRALAQTSPPALREVRMRLASYLETLADQLEDAAEQDIARFG